MAFNILNLIILCDILCLQNVNKGRKISPDMIFNKTAYHLAIRQSAGQIVRGQAHNKGSQQGASVAVSITTGHIFVM